MISLQDQIKKFEKLVYNPQLEQFVTVDQMFTGGGITMESIIQETNFIVEELKKMNAVFKNYCKLNDKVYTKITEHELSVHAEQARLNSLVGSVDRKLDESVKKIKQLHEDTLNQNQQSRKLLAEQLNPIKKQLGQKVDEATFSAMVKKYLEEQNQEQNNQEANESNLEDVRGQGQNLGQAVNSDGPQSPYPKKKGKLSYNQFYKFRQELDALLKTSNQQIDEVAKEGTQAKGLIIKYIPEINKLSGELNESQSKVYKLEMLQTDNFNNVSTSIKNLTAQLNSRLNDQVWKEKFQNFQQKQIKPLIARLDATLSQHDQEMKKKQQENVNKFKEVDAEIMKSKNQVAINKKQIQKLNQRLKSTNDTISDHHQEFNNQVEELDRKLSLLSQETTDSINSLASSTQKDIKELQTGLASIVHTVEEAVVKVVNKRFDLQLKMIDKSIRQNAEAIKQTRIDVTLLEEDFKNVKQILSQKANFSDIVHHVEKKADKEDFKQLQNRLHETSQELIGRKMNESINISARLEKNQNSTSRKTPSISKSTNVKTLFIPHNVYKSEKKEVDSGTKLFMCGMEGHMLETRKSWTQSARRRNQKSTTAVVSDLIL